MARTPALPEPARYRGAIRIKQSLERLTTDFRP